MSGITLTDRQRVDWLRLIRSESIGPRTFLSLINRFGGAAAALEALPDLARQAGRSIRLCPVADAEREWEGLHKLGGRLIALGEKAYPVALQAIDSAPPLLSVLGSPGVMLRPCVAIVGSRNASAAGLKLTTQFARDLGEANFTIVSGLARGIDTAAHEASLATGTVAVLAGGLDKIYPPQNAALLERLLGQGAAISEMPLGLSPRGRDFPRRNRLVSGLSLGTIVVEAARKSGSLITARFAAEQGRQVFAVPGSPLDPRAEGGNHLIREGATLCAQASHVIEALEPSIGRDLFSGPVGVRESEGGPVDGPLWDELDLFGIAPAPATDVGWLPAPPPQQADPADARSILLNLLGATPISIDDLIQASGQPARVVSLIVMELELEGLVQRQPGGLLSRLSA